MTNEELLQKILKPVAEFHDDEPNLECANCREQIGDGIALAIREAIQDEREACARVAIQYGNRRGHMATCAFIANAIRTRSKIGTSEVSEPDIRQPPVAGDEQDAHVRDYQIEEQEREIDEGAKWMEKFGLPL